MILKVRRRRQRAEILRREKPAEDSDAARLEYARDLADVMSRLETAVRTLR
jgi:hypothetical protein